VGWAARAALEAGARIAVCDATLANLIQPLEPSAAAATADGLARGEVPPRRRAPVALRETLHFDNGYEGSPPMGASTWCAWTPSGTAGIAGRRCRG
jgi:hypothetical protein